MVHHNFPYKKGHWLGIPIGWFSMSCPSGIISRLWWRLRNLALGKGPRLVQSTRLLILSDTGTPGLDEIVTEFVSDSNNLPANISKCLRSLKWFATVQTDIAFQFPFGYSHKLGTHLCSLVYVHSFNCRSNRQWSCKPTNHKPTVYPDFDDLSTHAFLLGKS